MFNSKPLAVAVAAHISLMAASAGAAVLEETVVTAQKREQSIQDVGIAITAFTGDQLEQLGWTNAQQVTAMAPGVTTVQPNGEANYSVAIRGVANSDFTTNVESPVALYVDEIYISQMSGAGFQLYDMERVEILRGPQGTLFGRNATGGLVHYITKKPTEEVEGYIKGTVGRHDQYRMGLCDLLSNVSQPGYLWRKKDTSAAKCGHRDDESSHIHHSTNGQATTLWPGLGA